MSQVSSSPGNAHGIPPCPSLCCRSFRSMGGGISSQPPTPGGSFSRRPASTITRVFNIDTSGVASINRHQTNPVGGRLVHRRGRWLFRRGGYPGRLVPGPAGHQSRRHRRRPRQRCLWCRRRRRGQLPRCVSVRRRLRSTPARYPQMTPVEALMTLTAYEGWL